MLLLNTLRSCNPKNTIYQKGCLDQIFIRFDHQNITKQFLYKNLYLKQFSTKANDAVAIDKISKPPEDWEAMFGRWYKEYQDFVGITQILEAQNRVTDVTNQLINVQIERRKMQKEVESLNKKLLDTHQQITKAELYSEEHYSLFEKARVLNVSLKTVDEEFIRKEEQERDLFTHLSSAIKICHEKERTQSEHSKYWSILLSVLSACLASLITSINNWVRIKEIKEHSFQLHKKSLEKTEELLLKIAGHSEVVLPNKDEEYIETLRSSIKEEISKLNLSVPIPCTEPLVVNEISYTKVAGHMIIGATVGTILTAIICSTGGTS